MTPGEIIGVVRNGKRIAIPPCDSHTLTDADAGCTVRLIIRVSAMETTDWIPFTTPPVIDGYYDVRYQGTTIFGEKREMQDRWNWALGHWYDGQGRIRREQLEWRGSTEPLHAANCAVNLPSDVPGSHECDCFLRKYL